MIGDEPFAVLLADDLIDAEVPVMRQMTEIAAREHYSVIGVMPVPAADVGSYGIVETEAHGRARGRRSRASSKSRSPARRRRRWPSSAATC